MLKEPIRFEEIVIFTIITVIIRLITVKLTLIKFTIICDNNHHNNNENIINESTDKAVTSLMFLKLFTKNV